MNIHKNDRVLEVGSGNNPNWRADVLCDRYLQDSSERAGGFRIVIDRPFVVGDGYKLPFKKKAFDYVICSHIIEHLQYPQKFLEEIVRVARAGYIEVPSDVSERLFGWDFHRWYCSLQGNILLLRKKTEGVRWGNFFHRLIQNTIWFRRFFEEHEKEFYVSLEWKNTVSVKVEQGSVSREYLDVLDTKIASLFQKITFTGWKDTRFFIYWMVRRFKRKLHTVSRKLLWTLRSIFSKETRDNLTPLLSCPSCRGELKLYKHDTITCVNCQKEYPMVGLIPILLLNKEMQKGY